MHDFEAETADQICAAESEVERLRERAAALEADVLRLRSEIALALACTEQAQHIAAKAEAELDAITAALDGQPLPPDAGERVRRVAEMARFARDYECDRCGAFNGHGIGCRSCGSRGEEEPAPEDGHVWQERDGLPVCSRCGGVRNADKVTPCKGVLPAVEVRGEDDGLTDADRAAGWRWETAGRTRHLRAASGELVAAVDDDGWSAHCGGKGPATDAFGQCRAVAHLRKAGVLPGGEG